MQQVIFTAPTLIPNPSVRIQNSTSFLLEFSPPFLWPGQHIEYFVIKAINLNDGLITRYVVNSTSTDAVVSLTEELEASDLTVCACSELLFTVFAIGPDPTELSSFNVKGKISLNM